MDITKEETQILHHLDHLKEEWIRLEKLPQRRTLSDLSLHWETEWNRLQDEHREQKRHRDAIRSTLSSSDGGIGKQLDYQSQRNSQESRQFKHQRDQSLAALVTIVDEADRRIQAIQQLRKSLSHKLADLYKTLPLPPLSIPLTLLYEDAHLLAIDKPTGLLSVPGRGCDRQASVQRYLQQPYVDNGGRSDDTNSFEITAIHRLDQDTSGILLFAKDPDTLRNLQQQFARRQVHKTYEAILEHPLDFHKTCFSGTIELPLWGDPAQRPYQHVDYERGKTAITQFQVLSQGDRSGSVHATRIRSSSLPSGPRIQLTPLTGRTHQLRVHAAHPNGLYNPILGDRLYGTQPCDRLYLHATGCVVTHQGQELRIVSPAPF